MDSKENSESKEYVQMKCLYCDLLETWRKKNRDYGSSFDKSLDKFGLVASVVRMGDKMNRLETLINKPAEVSDEGIKDTLRDLSNYAMMTVRWMEAKEK